MIGFVGLGAAGGNVCDEAIQKGFEALAINFSQRDLDSLEFVEKKHYLLGSEGVGKQREVAKQLMKNNWESTIEFIQTHFSKPSIEIIMVVFSTSGGSGSGLSSFLVELLIDAMPDKTIVCVPILPDKSEVLINQVNTLTALEELSEIDVCVMPLDNQSLINQRGNVSKNILYKEVNSNFISLVSDVVSYTEKHSKNGILDKKDLLQIFSTKGICVISKTNISDISNIVLSEFHFTERIQQSWSNSIFTPIQYEQIFRAGIIFDGNEQLMEWLSYKKLFEVFSNGMPVDLFEGNYNEKKGTVISILSGLNWIHNRIEEIDNLIDIQKSKLQEINKTEYKSKNTSKTKLLDSITNPSNNKRKSVTDIINKYSR